MVAAQTAVTSLGIAPIAGLTLAAVLRTAWRSRLRQ